MPDLPIETVALTARDGARARIALHGGQVLSWVPAGGDADRLFLSPRAAFDPGGAIRGGVPVCFPQFSERGPLPKHGFVRNRIWQLAATGARADGAATAVLETADDADSRALWPHPFRVRIDVAVIEARLSVGLEVTNSGETALAFTGALHSYLAIGDLAAARVVGLNGVRYVDTTPGGGVATDGEPAIAFTGEVDRIYDAAPAGLAVDAPDGWLQIATEGFPETVVWNPGAGRCATIRDLPADGFQHYVCVEAAAALAPITVAPGAVWTGRQTLTWRPA